MNEKILIVYFSHDGEAYVDGNIKELEIGNTKYVAQMIEKITNGDLIEIRPIKNYPYKYMDTVELAKEEKETEKRPEIQRMDIDMNQYDIVILGYPNWWGDMPMILYTFLETYDLFGKIILPFCTHEGSGIGNTVANIRIFCPGAEVRKGLAIKGANVKSALPQIEKWLAENIN